MSDAATFVNCESLLKSNGWTVTEVKHGFERFDKEGFISVEISLDGNEMEFIDKNKYFLSEQLNYHTLVGVLITYRQLAFNFNPY